MQLYYCTDHDGHWPVPVASIVLAETPSAAKALLIEELRKYGIRQPLGDFTLVPVDLSEPGAIVLSDGEY